MQKTTNISTKSYNKETIAIINDNIETSNLLENILIEHGYKVIIYFKIEDLIIDFKTKLIDLAIVKDTILKSECSYIQKYILEQKIDLQIIYLLESKINWNLLREGVDDYIKLPFDSEELIYRIKGIIKRKKEETRDELTGAYTRKFLIKRFEEEKSFHKKSRKNLSIVFLDLDYFKEINDMYGHILGDEVLVKFVETVKDSLRNHGEIFRYGGDEFILLLPETTGKEAFKLIEEIRKVIKNKFCYIEGKKHNSKISFCAGIATIDDYDIDISIMQLLRKADEALYISKKSGKDKSTCCTYYKYKKE